MPDKVAVVIYGDDLHVYDDEGAATILYHVAIAANMDSEIRVLSEERFAKVRAELDAQDIKVVDHR